MIKLRRSIVWNAHNFDLIVFDRRPVKCVHRIHQILRSARAQEQGGNLMSHAEPGKIVWESRAGGLMKEAAQDRPTPFGFRDHT